MFMFDLIIPYFTSTTGLCPEVADSWVASLPTPAADFSVSEGAVWEKSKDWNKIITLYNITTKAYHPMT